MKAGQRTVVEFPPTKLNIIASAAFNYNTKDGRRPIPTRERGGPPPGVSISSPDYERLTKAKMRSQLRIALLNENDTIILGAFGCGAFDNPPELISRYYSGIIKEPEFMNKFKRIIFAIYLDSAGINNNYNIFRDTFRTDYAIIEMDIDGGGGGGAAAGPPVVPTTHKPQIDKTYNTIPNSKFYKSSDALDGTIIPSSLQIKIIRNERPGGENPKNGRWLYETLTPSGKKKIAWIDEESIIVPVPVPVPTGMWTCPLCTLINDPVSKCKICGTPYDPKHLI